MHAFDYLVTWEKVFNIHQISSSSLIVVESSLTGAAVFWADVVPSPNIRQCEEFPPHSHTCPQPRPDQWPLRLHFLLQG